MPTLVTGTLMFRMLLSIPAHTNPVRVGALMKRSGIRKDRKRFGRGAAVCGRRHDAWRQRAPDDYILPHHLCHYRYVCTPAFLDRCGTAFATNFELQGIPTRRFRIAFRRMRQAIHPPVGVVTTTTYSTFSLSCNRIFTKRQELFLQTPFFSMRFSRKKAVSDRLRITDRDTISGTSAVRFTSCVRCIESYALLEYARVASLSKVLSRGSFRMRIA